MTIALPINLKQRSRRSVRSLTKRLWLCMLLPVALASTVAGAATITLVDEQLNHQSIALQSMDEQTITFFDEKGNYQTRPTNRFLQLRLTLDTSGPSQKTQTIAPPPPKANAQNSAEQEAIPNEERLAQPAGQPAGQTPEQTAQNQQPALPQGWGIVELIDGQRLTGKLVGNDDAGQLMQWEHPQAGLLTFKLDHVRQWRMNSSPQQTVQANGSDQLFLTNGDVLLGFVSAVTNQKVSFIPQGATEAVAVELSRVKALALANAPLEVITPTALVVLEDDSRLRAKRVIIERGELRFVPTLRQSEQWVKLPLSSLRRLDFANERWQLLPWSAMARKTQAGGMVFAAPWPVREEEESLYLHAPVTVTFTLPADAAAIGATAMLDIPSADAAIGWADFVVTLRVNESADAKTSTNTSSEQAAGDVQLARLAINETNPQGRLHATFDNAVATSSASGSSAGRRAPRTLTLTLDPALNGPIMDRLKLTDAWVVVARPEAR